MTFEKINEKVFEKVKTVISIIEFSLQLIIYLLKRNAEKDTSN